MSIEQRDNLPNTVESLTESGYNEGKKGDEDMDLRHRLLQLKSANGYTTDALSELSGVPKGTINKLLNGETRNPTASTLKRLADALGCELSDLCGRPSDIPGVHRLGELVNADDLLPVRRRSVPLLGDIAAGQPIQCESEAEITVCAGDTAADLALRVVGDSMIGARIHDGDVVFIRRQDDVDDGQIAAVIIDGRATLKRLYHIPNGLQLLSENPQYPPMIFTYPACDSIRIVGLAVAFQSRL